MCCLKYHFRRESIQSFTKCHFIVRIVHLLRLIVSVANRILRKISILRERVIDSFQVHTFYFGFDLLKSSMESISLVWPNDLPKSYRMQICMFIYFLFSMAIISFHFLLFAHWMVFASKGASNKDWWAHKSIFACDKNVATNVLHLAICIINK